MTLGQAAQRGVSKLRKPYWAAGNFIALTVQDGFFGPWAMLHYPTIPGSELPPAPQQVLVAGDLSADWEECDAPADFDEDAKALARVMEKRA